MVLKPTRFNFNICLSFKTKSFFFELSRGVYNYYVYLVVFIPPRIAANEHSFAQQCYMYMYMYLDMLSSVKIGGGTEGGETACWMLYLWQAQRSMSSVCSAQPIYITCWVEWASVRRKYKAGIVMGDLLSDPLRIEVH